MGNDPPHPGDVVVHRHVRSRAVYALSRLNAPLQSSYKTYEEALSRAVGFARREHVDAWYTADECIYERLAGHRPSADGSPIALNSTCRLRRPDALVTSTPQAEWRTSTLARRAEQDETDGTKQVEEWVEQRASD